MELRDRLVRSPGAMFLVLLYLLGVHTFVGINLGGGTQLPAVLAAAASAGLLVKNLWRVRIRALLILMVILALAWIGVLFAPAALQLGPARMRSFLYFIYSLVLGYAIFLELTQWRRIEVAQLFALVSVILLIGSALENYTPFRVVSDTFRHAVFEQGVYSADARDIRIAGRVRPKLFTSEPSHLARFVLLSLTVWLGLTSARRKYLIYAVSSVVALFLIRSPILLLALPLAVVVRVYLDDQGLMRMIRRSPLRSFRAALVGLFGILFVASATALFIGGRVEAVLMGRDDSFKIRVGAPVLVAAMTIQDRPVFGSGIGGHDVLEKQMRSAFGTYGIDIERVETNLLDKLINAFWMHWIYLGVVGGVLALAGWRWFATDIGVRHYLFCLLTIIIFGQTMGAYVGVRIWSMVFLLFTVSALRAGRIPHIRSSADAPAAAVVSP